MRLAPFHLQWTALVSAIVGTVAGIAIWERGRWTLGFAAPVPRALAECGGGFVFALVLVGAADVVIVLATDFRHEPGRGFPVRELLAVFLPAVLHEELAFRGYPFQKLWRWRPRTAIIAVSLLFAAFHLGNDAVTVIGIANVFLGGVILSLAYARYQRLWFPIGLHFGWNIMSGPILGYGVSGYAAEATVFRTVGTGPAWLTGGEFGIEGSIIMTVVEVAAIGVLLRKQHE
jgi:membrane protease YdiL (CAAX protease family)